MNLHRFLGLAAAIAGIAALAGCGSGGSGGSSGTRSSLSSISGRAVNSSGQPVSGAKVSLLTPGSQSRAAIESTTTDVNGNFTLTNVAAGSYSISVAETLPDGTVDTVLVTVTVPAGTTINLTVDLSATSVPGPTTGSVFGTVKDDTGAPVVGATVMLHSQTDTTLPVLKTTTDTTGSFSFATVVTGLWVAQVQGKHISNARSLVDVEAGESSEVDLIVSSTNNGNDQ